MSCICIDFCGCLRMRARHFLVAPLPCHCLPLPGNCQIVGRAPGCGTSPCLLNVSYAGSKQKKKIKKTKLSNSLSAGCCTPPCCSTTISMLANMQEVKKEENNYQIVVSWVRCCSTTIPMLVNMQEGPG